MPTIDGGIVFPSPLKAPAVVDSIHINSCESPNILRYTIPYLIDSSSGMKIENSGFAAKIRSPVANIPIIDIIPIPTKYPLKTLSHYLSQ